MINKIILSLLFLSFVMLAQNTNRLGERTSPRRHNQPEGPGNPNRPHGPMSLVYVNCETDSDSRVFSSKSRIKCSVNGRNAIGYEIYVLSRLQWTGILDPSLEDQIIKEKDKSVGGHRAIHEVFVKMRDGSRIFAWSNDSNLTSTYQLPMLLNRVYTTCSIEEYNNEIYCSFIGQGASGLEIRVNQETIRKQGLDPSKDLQAFKLRYGDAGPLKDQKVDIYVSMRGKEFRAWANYDTQIPPEPLPVPPTIEGTCKILRSSTPGHFRDTFVRCTITGRGAVRYTVFVDGIPEWENLSLDPRRIQQTVETNDKNVGGLNASYEVIVESEKGTIYPIENIVIADENHGPGPHPQPDQIRGRCVLMTEAYARRAFLSCDVRGFGALGYEVMINNNLIAKVPLALDRDKEFQKVKTVLFLLRPNSQVRMLITCRQGEKVELDVDMSHIVTPYPHPPIPHPGPHPMPPVEPISVLPQPEQSDFNTICSLEKSNDSAGEYVHCEIEGLGASSYYITTNFENGVVIWQGVARSLSPNDERNTFTTTAAIIDPSIQKLQVYIIKRSNTGVTLVNVYTLYRPFYELNTIDTWDLSGNCENYPEDYAKAKAFAESSSGLNYGWSEAERWGNTYIKTHAPGTIDIYANRYRELYKLAENSSYINLPWSEARKYVLDRVENHTVEKIKEQQQVYQAIYSFTENGSYMNRGWSTARNISTTWIQRGYCGSVEIINQIKTIFNQWKRVTSDREALNKAKIYTECDDLLKL